MILHLSGENNTFFTVDSTDTKRCPCCKIHYVHYLLSVNEYILYFNRVQLPPSGCKETDDFPPALSSLKAEDGLNLHGKLVVFIQVPENVDFQKN